MILQFLFLGCSDSPQITEALCNGQEICERRLDQVTFAATHNSMSSAEDEWYFPNQTWNITTQLEHGIRGLNLDTYLWEDEAYLCHSYCDLGNMRLVDALTGLSDFLDSHPNEVIVITFQSALSPELTMAAFAEVGLDDRMYQHPIEAAWPTLQELIDAEHNLVVFSSDDGIENSAYMAQWTHWIDNPYSVQSIEEFSCEMDRGNPETASLFNLNHFITNPLANIDDSILANQYESLWNHAMDCWAETGMRPNQILVDFADQGKVLQVVQELNQRP